MTPAPAIWFTISPSEWGKAPEWMNVHFLLETEKCPRRAALRYSRYKELGNSTGYPEHPSQSLLIGRITHASVARIASQLALQGCNSVNDPGAVAVLKELGGYSRIIAAVTETVLAALASNPRVERIRESLFNSVRSKLPSIREQVQVLLSRMTWKKRSIANSPSSRPAMGGKKRSALQEGTHFEVELRAQFLKWKGIADFIQLTDGGCVITDFKTGGKFDQHRLQLLVYGLLWREDDELNPEHTPPSRLVISYPQGDEIISAVLSKDLDELAEQLKARTNCVREALETSPPKAIVSSDNCLSCDVRLLCRDYWTPERLRKCATTNRDNRFDDIEILLTHKIGHTTWEAETRLSSVFKKPTKVLVRLADSDVLLEKQFSPGKTLRLTNALHAVREPDETPLIHITNYSEPLFNVT